MKCLPIVTYHRVVNNPDEVGKFFMLKEEFEKDLLYIKEHGYKTINMNDLFEHLKGKQLPEKCIIIRVDDGYRNFFDNMFPCLKKYDMKAILAVIGIRAQGAADKLVSWGNKNKSSLIYLTWEELKEMSDSGYVEIQSHSYNLHSNIKGGRHGCKKLESESFEEYRNIFLNDLEKSRNILYEKIGKFPNTFIFPYSAVCEEAYEVIKESSFKASITNNIAVNRIFDDTSLLKLGGFGRYALDNREDFFSIVFDKYEICVYIKKSIYIMYKNIIYILLFLYKTTKYISIL